MDKALQKAESEGYGHTSRIPHIMKLCLLDPLFWQALGKSLGWVEDNYGVLKETHAGGLISHTYQIWSWRSEMVNFIDHLAEGKEAESFFEELLK